jgi:ABC-2 type transport system permease protein
MSALVSLSVASVALGYYVIEKYYHWTYSQSIQRSRDIHIDSQAAQQRANRWLFFLAAPTRALLNKELKLFSRDMSQALQLMMLIGLCAIYLYNFGTVSLLAETQDSGMPWWQPVLAIINFVMGIFVITAVCSRFVFPTISYEGKSFWILSAAPMTSETLLRTKFWIWFWPVALTATSILTSGALAIQAPVPVILGTAALALISTYGVVGLAVGLGTLFSFFDWEHSSQLSANLGSLLFMIASMFLVSLALGPIGLILCLFFACEAGYLDYTQSVQLSFFVSGFLLLYMHILVHRWALHAGVSALERKRVAARI